MAYDAIEILGRGGFGVVERVVDGAGQVFARKTLEVPAHIDVAAMKPRFEREVRYQRAITHPNVVHIFDHDLNANPPWFIMPMAECSLLDEMSVDRTLGGAPLKALFDILAGLEEIHTRGYCHRDLKPGNVLRFRDGTGQPFYALSDFGLMAVGEEASSTLTPSGMGGGTPAYQAPECAINFKRATARSDIYSFGALLHDIFAVNPKRLPHEELTGPGAIGPVIEKCTKRNAHRRYKDVAQLREALFEALNGFTFAFESGEEEKAVLLLADEAVLPSPENWDDIFDLLDANSSTSQPTYTVFRTLRLEHIQQLSEEDPDLLAALGKMFADHCRTMSFNFDYCDVLATKAQLFYDLGEVGLQADIAVAMLRLGLSHNRWFVERKFVQMVGPISSQLAERILVEMSVLGIDFPYEFGRMQRSISVSKDVLHPVLQAQVP
ncbi:serine/threonine-protein kinase [Sphingomonas sp.]|jgi:serine/threonine protein kinase|uniref:serine/threonine-protein kinase n=1 Tax=Sphingomonas sp. TaxID=28214 RepID=UPI0026324492|nr:serine/threonine-protein kinase [Sphingomonas sp.]MDF2603494.1 serine/threonine protein kinase [Sphingomonas sp.]